MKRVSTAILPLFLLLYFLVPLNTLAARSLSSGLSDSDVRALQNTLIAKGCLANGKATGYFGATVFVT